MIDDDENGHPDEGTIHAWLDDALSVDDAARVEAHVAECVPCAERVAEARGLIAGASRVLLELDDVPVPLIRPAVAHDIPRSSLWNTLRITPARSAIAAMLLVAVGAYFTQRTPATTASTRALDSSRISCTGRRKGMGFMSKSTSQGIGWTDVKHNVEPAFPPTSKTAGLLPHGFPLPSSRALSGLLRDHRSSAHVGA